MKVKIYNGRSNFYQYDINQKLIVEDTDVTQLHLSNTLSPNASIQPCYELNGMTVCDIPDSLLTCSGSLTVYAYTDGNYTKEMFSFDIVARKRPDTYVGEEDLPKWEQQEAKIVELEEKYETLVDDVDNKLSNKANTEHNHDNYYDKELLNDILANKANKEHGHDEYDTYGSAEQALDDAKSYASDIAKTKANMNHIHEIEDINGLNTRFNGKADIAHEHNISNITDLQDALNNKSNVKHTHKIENVDNLEDTLNSKAPKTHYHYIDDVYNLKEELNELRLINVSGGGGGGASVQADYNQNDETANDYIKNRPFYSEVEIKEILPPTELAGMDENGDGKNETHTYANVVEGIEVGQTYVVNYNGVDYACVAKEFDSDGNGNMLTTLGNQIDIGLEDTGEPFIIVFMPPIAVEYIGFGMAVSSLDGATSVTLSIKGKVETIKKLDSKFIDTEWLANSKNESKILYEAECEFISNNSTLDKDDLAWMRKLKPNSKVIISWNGVEYTPTLLTSDSTPGIIGYILGNLSIMGSGSDTGEPFLFMHVQSASTLESTDSWVYKSIRLRETVSVQVTEVVNEINKLPVKFNTEPIIFTTTDMTTATCNKTYQECVEAINNNFFNFYFVAEAGSKSIMQLAITLHETDLEMYCTMFGLTLTVIYNEDGTIEIQLPQE